jgi:hypothetical protein
VLVPPYWPRPVASLLHPLRLPLCPATNPTPLSTPGDNKWKTYPSKKAYVGVETIKADPNGRKFNFLFRWVSACKGCHSLIKSAQAQGTRPAARWGLATCSKPAYRPYLPEPHGSHPCLLPTPPASAYPAMGQRTDGRQPLRHNAELVVQPFHCHDGERCGVPHQASHARTHWLCHPGIPHVSGARALGAGGRGLGEGRWAKEGLLERGWRNHDVQQLEDQVFIQA